ncbi:MAG: bifunctional riboflavin kinase/FAD synthetase [Candidatus Omnitrophica bacterium]|nr:bifunctional riboflavin kinase/FAD synthetase [Candidatus Omnitrophota bacterium]
MKVILDAGRLPERYRNVVVAIGVFDGVHRGHQRVIGRAVDEARRIKGTSVVVTFHPHPVAVLNPDQFSGYIISLEYRLRLIKALGVDVCYVVPFSKKFARSSASDFAAGFLKEKLRTVKIVVGEDFNFGSRRQGTADTFSGYGLSVEKVPLLKINNTNIKSKVIKEFIHEGELNRLKVFLGRDYGVFAEVERGERVGRRLGFPTANLKRQVRENVILLPPGIYIARVTMGEKKHPAVFYIGTRPTIKKHHGIVALEAHVLDFKGDLYGKKILVEFLKKLRNDKMFSDENALVCAIAHDIARARSYFKKNPA